MASTNFLQWNPSSANQEADSQYVADSARTGGAGVGSTFSSQVANKLFYQISTFVSAFCLMLSAKGFTTSDADITQLASVLAGVLTTADQKPALQVIAYAPSITFDLATANGFEVTLNGNVTSVSILNAAPGQMVTIILIQDAIGNRTFAWPSAVNGSAPIDPTPNVVNVQTLIVRSDSSLHAITATAAN